MSNAVPRVFISYSHDSDDHKDRVLALSDRLRRDGIDCEIDQYEQSPPEGWPRWMSRQVKAANFVLVVPTETYSRRFANDEKPGRGKGAKWEGAIITQALYEAEAHNMKFIPVLVDRSDVTHIPELLRGATHYVVENEAGYQELYRRLTNQPGVKRPDLGKLMSLPPRRRAAAPAAAEGRRAKVRVKPTDTIRHRRPKAPRAPTEDFVLLRRQDGSFVVLPSERIERTELLSVHVRAKEPSDVAFLNNLRQARGHEIAIVYDLHATNGKLQDIRSTRERGKEVWVLNIREDATPRNAFGEVAYGNMSADQVAEARARHLLLDENLPDRFTAFGGIVGWGGRHNSGKQLWPQVIKQYGQDRRRLLIVARLAFVLELWTAGIIAHVRRLDLTIKSKHLLVNFEGQRPSFYSNVEPPVITIRGERPL